MSLFTILGILFSILKLLGLISWSWWLVLLPFFIDILIGLVTVTVTFLLFWRGR